MLGLYSSKILLGVALPESDELFGLIPVKMLLAFLKVDDGASRIAHIPVHIHGNIHIDSAYRVDDLFERRQVYGHIMVNVHI